ncbi:hypothetical protein KDL44_00280 [bacterium]|nr:hypothetical protein [bacterium]
MRRSIFAIILLLLVPGLLWAEDCCPGLRSSEGEISLGLDRLELAVAEPDAARELWQAAMGFSLSDWQPRPGGVQGARMLFADGTSLDLLHCGTALDRRAQSIADLSNGGGGTAGVVLTGTALEHLRFALEAVEEPLEFIDHRTSIELSRPPDPERQPLRFAQYLLPSYDARSPREHANGAEGIRAVWLESTDPARDLLLLELLGGSDAGERSTPRGVATAVSMQGVEILLHTGQQNRWIGLELQVPSLQQAAGAMSLPGISAEGISGGPGSSFCLHPQQTGGIWLQFTESPAPAVGNP